MPQDQSVYRRGHSTESAILKIFNDVVDTIMNGLMALLCLLDLSVAFDMVNLQILIRQLETSYGVSGHTLLWNKSYLTDKMQLIRCNGCMLERRSVRYGVSQESVLGPLLFSLYKRNEGNHQSLQTGLAQLC